jgi:hypothetical protein
VTQERRDIPGAPGYTVTSDGQIWSTRRAGRWLKPYLHPNGYLTVHLRVGGKTIGWKVHRAVALAWVANPDAKPFINHMDGDKQNNSAANLEWCTRSENLQHAWDTGLRRVTAALVAACKKTGSTPREGRARNFGEAKTKLRVA